MKSLNLVRALVLFGLFSLGLACDELTADSTIAHIFEEHIRPSLSEYLSEEEIQQVDEQYDSTLFAGLSIKTVYGMLGTANMNETQCANCHNLLKVASLLMKSKEIAISMLGSYCKDGPKLSKRMCMGLLERLADPLIWVLQNADATVDELCVQLTSSTCLKHLNVTEESRKKIFWELELPPVRAEPFKPILSSPGETKNILHLTDIHLDLWYAGESMASCNEALCCRDNSIDMMNKSFHAGHWASDHGACDIPLKFVVDSLKQFVNRHKFDAVFWTGDNVPHDVWNTTQEINLRHIHAVSSVVRVAFDGIPIFPALGNHETHPINLYVPRDLSEKANLNMSWLYEPIIDEYWAPWITTEAAKESFLKGGYYAKDMNSGWKVIVLNTNMAQKDNFWQAASYRDPDGQLAWLIQELDDAEKTGKYVSILGHIPPGFGIYDTWLHNYIRIVDRYQHIINAGYFGHTHKDEVKVLYNEKQEPININYLSGSLTTYSFLNPMYAVYQVNERGFVQDSTVYMSNVRENEHSFQKNHEARPEWHKEYSPKTSYNMEDMSARSWDKFLTAAEKNIDLAHLYSGHYHRFSPQYTKHHPFSEKKLFQLIKAAKPCSPFHEKCVLPEHDDDEDDDDDDGGGFD